MATLRYGANGSGPWFAEAVATFGLLLTILGCSARTPSAVPFAVGLYITAAYWFTASTSFANPAVTIARSLSDTFAGIAPTGVAAFIVANSSGCLRRSFSPGGSGERECPRRVSRYRVERFAGPAMSARHPKRPELVFRPHVAKGQWPHRMARGLSLQ